MKPNEIDEKYIHLAETIKSDGTVIPFCDKKVGDFKYATMVNERTTCPKCLEIINKDDKKQKILKIYPIENAPKDGTIVQVLIPMRYLPYKKLSNGQPNSMGHGRWQELSSYGWKNSEYDPIEWCKNENKI